MFHRPKPLKEQASSLKRRGRRRRKYALMLDIVEVHE